MTEVTLHTFIRKNDKLVLTPERINLLRIIAKTGSLLTASRTIGISYNKAWKMLDAVNTAVDGMVVEKLRGGKGGGGATLTEYGKFILSEYEAIEDQVSKFVKKLNTEINM